MKILFLGFNHRINDPRLFYRQMQALKKKQPQIEIYFLSRYALYNLAGCFNSDGRVKEEEILAFAADCENKLAQRLVSRIGVMKYFLSLIYIPSLIVKVLNLRPSVIQASDIREILLAFFLHILTRARIIYDAHEDYFNQIYEYSGKTFVSFIYAWFMSYLEILLLRHFSAVFCADDYVVEKYSQKRYRCNEVHILRNYPVVSESEIRFPYVKKDRLDLIYIGGVNEYRGVIECAEYVNLFNKENNLGVTLSFTVYSPRNQIIENLLENNLIIYKRWTDYMVLMGQLPLYDIGVCLWHPLDKLKNNLPLKNFDYMSVGLPILTSNFGNLKIYAERSGAALCINPFSYEEFSQAIYKLTDLNVRKLLSENGLSYVKLTANFEKEAVKYIKTLTVKER